MIHQCFFKPSQAPVLFRHDPYRPFGLEPECNPDITLKCPELATAKNRLRIEEYAAMLWLWRNGLDDDPWIGFTSYRQLEKGYPFIWKGKADVEDSLRQCDVAAWGHMRFTVTLSMQAELFHPGINETMGRLLQHFNEPVPRAYHKDYDGCFASYWAMSRGTFTDWMHWLWPMVEWLLRHDDLPYLRDNKTWHLLERLFLVWYMNTGRKVGIVGYYQGQGTTDDPVDHPDRLPAAAGP